MFFIIFFALAATHGAYAISPFLAIVASQRYSFLTHYVVNAPIFSSLFSRPYFHILSVKWELSVVYWEALPCTNYLRNRLDARAKSI